MDNNKRFESIYSSKVKAGKRRTYFFDVRKTKGEDFYITITESTKRFQGDGYERHKIFLYKEDFNRFMSSLNDVVDHVKTELMPDFDYELYEKRQLEWEAKLEAGELDPHGSNEPKAEPETAAETESTDAPEKTEDNAGGDDTETGPDQVQSEEDMSW